MKYCPYCGVVLADGAAPFCADCGKELPNTAGQNRKKQRPPKLTRRPQESLLNPKEKSQKNTRLRTPAHLLIKITAMTVTTTMSRPKTTGTLKNGWSRD